MNSNMNNNFEEQQQEEKVVFGDITLNSLYTTIYQNNLSARKKLLEWIDDINDNKINGSNNPQISQFASVVQSSFDTLNKYDANLIKIAEILTKNTTVSAKKSKLEDEDSFHDMTEEEQQQTVQAAKNLLKSFK